MEIALSLIVIGFIAVICFLPDVSMDQIADQSNNEEMKKNSVGTKMNAKIKKFLRRGKLKKQKYLKLINGKKIIK